MASFNSHASKWFRRTNDYYRRLWVLNDFKFEKYFKRLPPKFDSAHFGDIRFLDAWLLISVFNSKRTFFSNFTISVIFWNHRNLSVCFDFYPFFNVRLKNWLIRFYFLVRDFWLNLEEEFVKSISSLPNDSEKTDKSWEKRT